MWGISREQQWVAEVVNAPPRTLEPLNRVQLLGRHSPDSDLKSLDGNAGDAPGRALHPGRRGSVGAVACCSHAAERRQTTGVATLPGRRAITPDSCGTTPNSGHPREQRTQRSRHGRWQFEPAALRRMADPGPSGLHANNKRLFRLRSCAWPCARQHVLMKRRRSDLGTRGGSGATAQTNSKPSQCHEITRIFTLNIEPCSLQDGPGSYTRWQISSHHQVEKAQPRRDITQGRTPHMK